MKNPVNLFAAFLIGTAFVLASCEKEPENIPVPEPHLENVFGSWELVRSSGGDNFQIHTPATLGYTTSLKFNRNGQVLTYKNERLTQADHFTFKYNSDTYAYKTNYSLEYKNGSTSWVYISNDTLFLYPVCNDCFDHVYVRK